jgi:diaminohydroxyphosphoribosylaminopyrimidine deaminase/5-amino-6-(5-phosphoribosylamino)uracil reductase
VIIEGGAQLIQSFIDERAWDEARVITNRSLEIEEGVRSPQLTGHQLLKEESIKDDVISYYQKH